MSKTQIFWNGAPVWLLLSLPLLLYPHPITWGIVAVLFVINAAWMAGLLMTLLFRP